MQLSHSGFTEAEAKGLVGELTFLESQILPRFDTLTSVRGWVGPEGSSQDFRISGVLIEVKTCELGSEKITVSSLDQLNSGGKDLFLVVLSLTPSSDQNEAAFTLNELVVRIRAIVARDEAALDEFNVRLAQTGYDERHAAARLYFHIAQIRAYRVDEGFPTVTRTLIPAAILSLSYVIDISACTRFQCELGDICDGHQ